MTSLQTARRNQLDNPALPIVAYLAVVGLLAMFSGGAAPDAVEQGTPWWLQRGWSLTLAAGGVLATIGCLTARTRAESAGLAVLLFGLSLYALAEIVTQWPLGLQTASALLALIGCCALRMRVLHLARKAQRLAHLYGEARPWTD